MEIPVNDTSLLQKIEFDAGTTNTDILTDLERKRARTWISEFENQVLSLDQEIERVAERGRLWRFRIALAPHKRLPPEILADAFVYTLADDFELTFPPDMSRPPWVLSKVCSRWRQVALNEPRLWNRISLPKGIYTQAVWLPKIISMFDSILPTTGFLSISPGDVGKPTPLAIIHAIIVPNLSRLTELSICITIPTFQDIIQNAPQNSLHSLRWLSLVLCHGGRDPGFIEQCRDVALFQNAVNLKNLHLHAAGRAPITTNAILSLPFPWNRLTSLDLTALRPFSLFHLDCVLQQCLLLQQLHAGFSYVDEETLEESIVMGGYLDLPHLHRIELEGYLASNPLDTLRLPWEQLTVLRFGNFRGAAGDSDIFQILPLCVRIEELSALRLEYQASDFAAPFLLPRLIHLKLGMSESSILDHLIVPALTSLHIMTYGISIRVINISNMIIRSGCSLSIFVHRGTQGCDDEALRRFFDLIPSVHELRMNDLFLDGPTIQYIGKGNVVPRLAVLTCRLQRSTMLEFVDLLKLRVKERDTIVSLRHAVGYISSVDTDAASLEDAQGRVKQLNAVHGTGFHIILDTPAAWIS